MEIKMLECDQSRTIAMKLEQNQNGKEISEA